MSESGWREFAGGGQKLGVVGVSRPSKGPHLTPVWFIIEGDDVVFATSPQGVKGKALTRDPRIAVCVSDDAYPYNFVLLEGEASISDDREEHKRLALAIGERYASPEAARGFAEYSLATQVLMRMRIGKVTAHAAVAQP
jgi:PPOX class probable F420-dependent enzyme